MRVLLDACIDPRAAQVFAGHEVRTASETGWHKLKDHLLLPKVQEQFDVFVTIDRGFEHQHNLKSSRSESSLSLSRKTRVEFYRALKEELLRAVDSAKSGTVVHVPA